MSENIRSYTKDPNADWFSAMLALGLNPMLTILLFLYFYVN